MKNEQSFIRERKKYVLLNVECGCNRPRINKNYSLYFLFFFTIEETWEPNANKKKFIA